jgi:hypothetical protein
MRSKNSSNAFVPSSSREDVQMRMKKMSWWEKNLLCQNIVIRNGQYDAYWAQACH